MQHPMQPITAAKPDQIAKSMLMTGNASAAKYYTCSLPAGTAWLSKLAHNTN